MINLQDIPFLPKRQDELTAQLSDLIGVANRLGMYDAADALTQIYKNVPVLKYGCHCDLEPDMKPDGCVIDEGVLSNCIYAKPNMRKEQCKYWRLIK